MSELKLFDANEIVKVAERAYNEWSLAMVGADDTRKVNEVFKKQYLCKVVKAVVEIAPPSTRKAYARRVGGRLSRVRIGTRI